MATTTAAELLQQLEVFNRGASIEQVTGDPELHIKLQRAASRLARDLEDPATTTFRLSIGQACEAAVIKIALETGLFPLLAKDNQRKTLPQLAQGTKIDPKLLHRILRFMAAFGVLDEHDDQTYSLPRPYALLADEHFSQATCNLIGLIRTMVDALPDYVKENGYRNPEDRLNGIVQKAFNAPGKDIFDILKGMHPDTVKSFSTFLQIAAQDSLKPHQIYPVQERLVDGFDATISEVFWVDVGGGFGQITLDLKRTFPGLPGRCVVQDVDLVVEQAKSKGLTEHVEFAGHDFFTEQPIKDARTYYFRECFHNWQDANCEVMLRRTAEAMKAGYSRLLIHDVVMPEQNAGKLEVMMDWMMMTGYSTMERSEAQFLSLVESAGLSITKIYSNPGSSDSVIEITKT